MRTVRWLLGALFLVAMFAIPSAALAQGTDDPVGDDPAITQGDDPGDAPADPSLEPPQVLQDPGSDQPAAPVQGPTDENLAPSFAPPVTELNRFSDEDRAPRWQQRDNWRQRGLFYRWRFGWFVRRQQQNQFIWWQWRDGRWSRCDQPGDFRDDVVRPEPLTDPSPGTLPFNPVNHAIAPIVAPQHVVVPQQQNNRLQALRRALRVCQVRYVRSVIVLRILRQRGRITFQQYVVGVRRALVRRAVCRRVVFRAFSVRR